MATLWLIGGQELLVPNVAIEGEATQSSTHMHHGSIPLNAQYAIDGNFSTNLRSGARFAHTNVDACAWWQVDLKNEFEIIKVAVTTRKHS